MTTSDILNPSLVKTKCRLVCQNQCFSFSNRDADNLPIAQHDKDKLLEINTITEETRDGGRPTTGNVNTISSVWQELCRSLILIAAIFITTPNLWLLHYSKRCHCPRIIIKATPECEMEIIFRYVGPSSGTPCSQHSHQYTFRHKHINRGSRSDLVSTFVLKWTAENTLSSVSITLKRQHNI